MSNVFTFLLKSLQLSRHCSVEISAFSSLSCFKPLLSLHFLFQSLPSLHWPIEISAILSFSSLRSNLSTPSLFNLHFFCYHLYFRLPIETSETRCFSGGRRRTCFRRTSKFWMISGQWAFHRWISGRYDVAKLFKKMRWAVLHVAWLVVY